MKKSAKKAGLPEIELREPTDKKQENTSDTDKSGGGKSGKTPSRKSPAPSKKPIKGDRVGKRLADAIAIEVADTDLSAITVKSTPDSQNKPRRGSNTKKSSARRGAKSSVKNNIEAAESDTTATETVVSTDEAVHSEENVSDKATPDNNVATAEAEIGEADASNVTVDARDATVSNTPGEAVSSSDEEGSVSLPDGDSGSQRDDDAAPDKTVTDAVETEKNKKKKIRAAVRGDTDIELNAKEKKAPTANVKKKKRRFEQTEAAPTETNELRKNQSDDTTVNGADITERTSAIDDDEYAEISGEHVESYDPFASLADEDTDAPQELFPIELAPYEDDVIEDTHESAEEAASYEAFVQDYQATIQEMLRRAAEKEYNTDSDGNPQLTIEADDELDDELFEDGTDEGDEDEDTLDDILVSEESTKDTDEEDEEYLSGEDYEAILKASDADTSGAIRLEDVLAAEAETEAVEETVEEDISLPLPETDEETVEVLTADEAEHFLYLEKRDNVIDNADPEAENEAEAADTVTETDVDDLQIKLEDTQSGAAVLNIAVRSEEFEEPQDEQAVEETAENDDDIEDTSDDEEQITIKFEEDEKTSEDDEADEEYEDETPPAYNPDKPRFIDTVFEIVELFVFTLVAVMVITSFFLRHSIVDGSSMQHTLEDKDILLISDFLYTPERGDIIVFADYEKGQRDPLVKRIIGIEGDVVEVTNDYKVYVNGELLDEEYVLLDEPYLSAITGTWRVGEGELFVLGDHRSISLDSRAFGVVSEDCVLGKVLLRLYPFDSFGTVE